MCRIVSVVTLLLVALAQAPSAGGALEQSGPFESVARSWTLRSARMVRTVQLTRDGAFRTASLRALPEGPEWVPATLPSPEFRLVVRFARGEPRELTGESGWCLARHQSGPDGAGERLAITLDSTTWPLQVTVRYRWYPDATAVRTDLTVRNTGGEPVTLLEADSFCLRLATGNGSQRPWVSWVRNFTWAQPDIALLPEIERLSSGEEVRVLTGPFGVAGAWMAVRRASGGAGVFAGWEWSGTGEMAALLEADGTARTVRLRAGLAAEAFRHELAPGEELTTPTGFVGLFTGTWDAAAEATHDFTDRHLALPRPAGPFPLAAFNTWGYGLDVDEALVHRLVDEAADLGLELFTLDAGWMATLGDFTPRPGAFDRGLEAIARHVHARGMRFGLWIAFGSADPEAPILREHPGWRATRKGEPIVGDFDGHAICLANPEARAQVLRELHRVIEAYRLDWLVHDFQVIERCDDTSHGHQAGDGDRATTAGYYAIMDELRARHPDLILSNCWDGGNMLDFGMVARHHSTNLNDGNDALGNRRAVYGGAYFLPPRYLEKYVGDDGTPDDYRFLSGIPGGTLHVMGRPTEWSDETRARAREAVALFKAVRPVLADGTVRHLTMPPSAGGWDSLLQYDAASGQGVLSVFRAEADSAETLLRPRGLPADASFDLELGGDGDARSLEPMTGSELAMEGLTITLPEAQDGAIIQLIRGD